MSRSDFSALLSRLSLVVVFCFFAGCSAPSVQKGNAPPAAAMPLRLACVGDSITDGYQMPDKAHFSYPAQLGRLLGAEWEVRNFGASGATLTRHTGYPYDERPVHADALAWKPDIVVIALG